MTSRVQKGGPIFRPVVQPRARAPSVTLRSQAPEVQPTLPLSTFSASPQTHEQPTRISQSPTRLDSSRNAPTPPVLTNQGTARPAQFIPATPIHVSHGPPTFEQPPGIPLSTPTSIHVQTRGPSMQPPPPPPPFTPSTTELNGAEQPRTEDTGQSITTVEKPRRKRKSSTAVHGEPETISRAKRTRRTSSARRSRGPSLPPYDPGADPGDELDPTVVTMATLCDDIGKGRVSSKATEVLSNHAAWKSRNREKRARMRTLMELKKYGREAEADNENQDGTLKESDNATPQQAQTDVAPAVETTTGGDNEVGFDYTQGLAVGRFNVQVRIGPNGETIIDEESLVVDRTEVENTQEYTHVVESDTTKFVNSATYAKKFRGSRWSAEETERFYDALSQYGENYELIAYVLPGRDRKSCKNKFKVEDRKNPARINYCLNNRVPVDMQTLSRMTGKDFSGPVPEIRAPTATGEGSGTTGHDSTDGGHAETVQIQKAVNRNRSRKVGIEDGVVIIGSVESDHDS